MFARPSLSEEPEGEPVVHHLTGLNFTDLLNIRYPQGLIRPKNLLLLNTELFTVK